MLPSFGAPTVTMFGVRAHSRPRTMQTTQPSRTPPAPYGPRLRYRTVPSDETSDPFVHVRTTVRSSSAVRTGCVRRVSAPLAFEAAACESRPASRMRRPPMVSTSMSVEAAAPAAADYWLPSELAQMPVTLRAPASPAGRSSRRILCYGDSLTAGFFSGGTRFEPYARALLRELSAAGVSCEVSLCGHSGRTTREMVEAANSTLRDVVGLQGKGLSRILQENGPFDLVLIMAGTNDMGYGAQQDEILERLRSLHEVSHRCGVDTVVLAPPPAPHSGAGREVIRQRLVRLLHRMAGTTDRIVACVDPADYLPASETRFWDPDGLHFSPAGSRQLGKCLATLAMEHLFVEPTPTPRVYRDTAPQRYTTSIRAPSAPRQMPVANPERLASLPAFCMFPVFVCA